MLLMILLLVAAGVLVALVVAVVARDGYGSGAPPRSVEPWWAGTTLQGPR